MLRRALTTLTSVLVISILSSCAPAPLYLPLDGGMLVRNGETVYWSAADFPIDVYVDTRGSGTFSRQFFDTIKAIIYVNGIIPEHLGPLLVFKGLVDYDVDVPAKNSILITFSNHVVSGKGVISDGIALPFMVGNSSRFHSCKITMDMGVPAADFVNVVNHELGHCLGLAHDPGDDRSIMYPYSRLGSPQYWMPDDIDKLIAMKKGILRQWLQYVGPSDMRRANTVHF